MGLFTEKITLKNSGDVYSAGRGYIKEEEIRQVIVDALVDSGASAMVIPETVRAELGLQLKKETEVSVVGGKLTAQVAEPVEVHWQDRMSVCTPLVIPVDMQPLLGALPMEEMDIMVHPKEGRLVGAHGDKIVLYAVGVRVE
ncbi:MAG: aspartyl protease family protein [Spirochaetaceae bacterium]|jgi:predicted aspartyl protease|nr:aspartyl protease family protein [Spirochaetaceae bacterium]